MFSNRRAPRVLIAFCTVLVGLLLFAGPIADAHGPPEHANGHGKGGNPDKGGDELEPVQPSPTVTDPTVTGPIQRGVRGGAYNRSRFPLVNGYVEEEFFYEGTAVDADGNTAPYKTRILVRRPSDPERFNGSVVLDWTNVTVPDDTDVSWLPMHVTIMERGFAYVSVAAQRLGVEASPIALKQYDPVRYGSLSHPGDDFSFDIYSQAAEAVLNPIVLDDLRPRITRRLGVGASQSGGRLKTYINDWAEQAGVFEGFMPQISGPDGVRRDLVPVLWLNSQSEIDPEPVPADTDLFRMWEITGSSHAPHGYSQYQNSGYVYHESNGELDTYDRDEGGAWGYQFTPGECVSPNVYNPAFVYSSALVALDDWVRTGEAPPSHLADRTGGELHFDDLENMQGGLRTPLNDVPIAKYYAGTAPPGTDECGQLGVTPLLGSTRMMTGQELTTRYGSAEGYAAEFEDAIERALADGVILPEGAVELRQRLVKAKAWVAEAIAGTVTPVALPTP